MKSTVLLLGALSQAFRRLASHFHRWARRPSSDKGDPSNRTLVDDLLKKSDLRRKESERENRKD
ncbi:hypothetical protein [Variovorax sp. PAMC26660]|uniref:hypothetical protein n=1 Tax=Variovorax sp. PAMC26660 TaxID=2762322 RepID=UPI00164CE300|nr:hypothetical protein [Variovorax sp. PAMC26660]QNK67180.1 hypothetical protein H7F35_29150 [Variovorax sp. PAMC26660]